MEAAMAEEPTRFPLLDTAPMIAASLQASGAAPDAAALALVFVSRLLVPMAEGFGDDHPAEREVITSVLEVVMEQSRRLAAAREEGLPLALLEEDARAMVVEAMKAAGLELPEGLDQRGKPSKR